MQFMLAKAGLHASFMMSHDQVMLIKQREGCDHHVLQA